MEESVNPLRFETNPYHHVVIKDRKTMELSGVKQIDSFDSDEFLLETTLGWMLINGKDLSLGKLDTEHGDLIIKGNIDSINYLSNKKVSVMIFYILEKYIYSLGFFCIKNEKNMQKMEYYKKITFTLQVY